MINNAITFGMHKLKQNQVYNEYDFINKNFYQINSIAAKISDFAPNTLRITDAVNILYQYQIGSMGGFLKLFDSNGINICVKSVNSGTFAINDKYNRKDNNKLEVEFIWNNISKGEVVLKDNNTTKSFYNETYPNIVNFVADVSLPSYSDGEEYDIMNTTRYKETILSELVSAGRVNSHIKSFDYEEINDNEIVDIQPRKNVEIKSEMVYAKRV